MSLPPGSLASATLAVAALVLMVAGGAKLRSPGDTARALRRAGLGVRPWMVRTGAALEMTIAVGALTARSTWWASAVALSYLGFAGFILVALVRQTPLATCGCFGEPDTPPTLTHLVVDLALAVGATAAVLVGPEPLARIVLDQPAAGTALLAGVVVVAGLCIAALTALPQVQVEARRAGDAVLGPHATRRAHR